LIYKILNVLSLGILSACSKNIKNIITKGKETIRFAISVPNSPSVSKGAPNSKPFPAKSSSAAVNSPKVPESCLKKDIERGKGNAEEAKSIEIQAHNNKINKSLEEDRKNIVIFSRMAPLKQKSTN
jgi:hypothetical protein